MKKETSKSNSKQKSDKVLSFKKFTERDLELNTPKYNNFVIFFSNRGLAASLYQKKDFFQRFQKEHPNLYQELRKNISSGDNFTEWRRYERDLHKAYKIMRDYGASDSDLFT